MRSFQRSIVRHARACFPLLQGVGSEAWQARPAVLATKVALMEELGQAEEAAAGLDSALRQWQAGAAGTVLAPRACDLLHQQACLSDAISSCLAVLVCVKRQHPGLPPACAAPDSAVRSEALRWIVERLAALHLRRGALQEAAGLYQQLLSLDASALSGVRSAVQ